MKKYPFTLNHMFDILILGRNEKEIQLRSAINKTYGHVTITITGPVMLTSDLIIVILTPPLPLPKVSMNVFQMHAQRRSQIRFSFN